MHKLTKVAPDSRASATMAHVFSPNPTAIEGKWPVFCATLINRDLQLKSKNNMICAVKESIYGCINLMLQVSFESRMSIYWHLCLMY